MAWYRIIKWSVFSGLGWFRQLAGDFYGQGFHGVGFQTIGFKKAWFREIAACEPLPGRVQYTMPGWWYRACNHLSQGAQIGLICSVLALLWVCSVVSLE